jgi:predicted AAA+ superfamily ATPase
LKNVAEGNRKYVTLDNPLDLELAKTDPKLFFERDSPPVLIDEIQYAPELFVYMKMILDSSDQRGRIWMTGSQQHDMMRGITESLAGRVAILEDVDIAPNTAKKWLSVLEASGLVFLLQPYFKNMAKRLIKTPKLYFMDTGLAAYLARWTTPEALEEGASAGAFFETFVVSEIVKSHRNGGESPQLYYFRDGKRNEIYLLIHQNDAYHPIEIRKTSNPKVTDMAAFKIFSKIEKLGYGALLCLVDEPYPLTDGASAISVWDI